MIIKDENRIVSKPLVTVQVFAYNKELYIRECLDSIVSQETSFEYEVIVSENPGTDKTREICLEYQKKYPDKIILVLREKNMGLFYNYFEAEDMSRGKYIARCDGDDYWCDTQKLQKQIDVLETNEKVGLCYTRCRVYNESTKSFKKSLIGKKYKGFKKMLKSYPIPQPTIMYRKEMCKEYFEEVHPREKNWLMEDLPRHLWFSYHSDIVRLDDVTTVYRVVSNSMCHNEDFDKQALYYKSILEIKLYFFNLYCSDDIMVEKQIYNRFFRDNIRLGYNANRFQYCLHYVKEYHYCSMLEFWELIEVFIRLLGKSAYTYLLNNR